MLPPAIKQTLREIEKRFGPVVIISTFRKNALIAGTRQRSKHAKGLAVDFIVTRNAGAALRWLRKQPLEVINYGCAMHHFHIAPGSYKGYHCVNSAGIRKNRVMYAREHKTKAVIQPAAHKFEKKRKKQKNKVIRKQNFHAG